MKTKILFLFLLLSGFIFGQSDPYGNYFNAMKATYPPKGDGVTNDRSRILTILTEKKSVFLPATSKGYYISGILNIPSGCRLIFDVGAKFVGPGTIKGNNTEIWAGTNSFAATLSFSGTFSVPFPDRNWFGSDEDFTTFQSLNSSGSISVKSLSINDLLIQKTAAFSDVIYDTVANETDTIDWTLSNIYQLYLNDTCSIHFIEPDNICHLTLKIVHDSTGTNYPVTIPLINWESGINYVPSSSADGVDIIGIFFDGSFYGSPGNDYK